MPAAEPNGEEVLTLPNVDPANGDGFGTVPLAVAKVPAFTNIELVEVSVPNVLFVLATATPNPAPANGAVLVLVESNCCELVVTNGPLIAADGAPNVGLFTDMVSAFCAPKTFAADTAVPKAVLAPGC